MAGTILLQVPWSDRHPSLAGEQSGSGVYDKSH